MNYELLKLSKILPTINGRKTLDVYQERLDMARKARQNQQAEAESQEQYNSAPKSVSSTNILRSTGFNSQPRLPRREPQLNEVKSADKLPNNNLNTLIDGYSNLQTLLKDEESDETLANLFNPKMRNNSTKNKGTNKFASTTSSPFFHQGESVDESNYHRPPTTSPHATLSNFVFKKKKIALRNTSELDHVYQYTQAKGFMVPSESTLGLNGRKVNVKGLSSEAQVRQQKKYLKELKQDPMTAFHSPYNQETDADLNLWPSGRSFSPVGKRSSHTSPKQVRQNGEMSSDIIAYAKGDKISKMNQNAKLENNPNIIAGIKNKSPKVNTQLMDGTYLKSFDQKASPAGLNNSSLVKGSKALA